MIDSRVEEKVAKLQAEHDEIVKKLKQNITGMIKPGALFGQRAAQSEAKAKVEDEKESTPSSRPSTGIKRVVPSRVGQSATTTKRSDSKESQKGNSNEEKKREAEEKKKEQLEAKRKEDDRKREEAKSKREELEKKKKDDAEKKKQLEEEKKRRL